MVVEGATWPFVLDAVPSIARVECTPFSIEGVMLNW